MFRKNKWETKKVTIVTTKEQLKAAVNRKDSYIEVQGDLAKKMNWMAKLSKKKIALVIAGLTGAAVAAPAAVGATGAGTAVAVHALTNASLAATGTGASTEVMALTALLGTVFVVAILNGYSIEADAVNGVLKLTKNK